jgi:hypothetical protein
MENKAYNRKYFKENGFEDLLGYYDSFIEYYNTLSDIAKNNFDIGLTLVVNTEFFRHYKRSSINREMEIIPEIMNFLYHVNEMLSVIKIDDYISYDKLSTTVSDYFKNNLKSTGKEKNSQEAALTKNLFYTINDFYTWYTSKENVIKGIDDLKYRELFNVQGRANSIINIASNEIISVEKIICFKSKYSVTKNPLKSIIDLLISMRYVNKPQKKLLYNAFNGFNIDSNEKIKWMGNNGELTYFLKKLNEKILEDYERFIDVCRIAALLFNDKDDNSLTVKQISNSRKPTEEQKTKIDNMFIKNP